MKPTHPQPQTLYKILGITCLTILSAVSSQAVDRWWTGGNGSYTNAANWTGGVVPNAADNAIVTNGSTVFIYSTDPNWLVNDIRAGDGAGTTGAWEHDGPTVTLNGWFRLGLSGSTGSYNMKSGIINNAGRHIVGENGTAVFWQTNTAVNNLVAVNGELWCGEAAGGNGTFHLAGNATMTVNNWLAIGRNSSIGVFNIGGNASLTKTGGGNITFAGIGTGTATLNQNGGAVTNHTSQTWLAENGTGFWNMTNGVASLGLLRFGHIAGSSGTFNLVGGTLMVNQIELGPGAGTFNFYGGTLMARAANANFMSGVPGDIQGGGARIDSQGFEITISTVLSGAAGANLTKLGSGKLTLSGTNTYSGASIVAAGKLIVDTTSTVTSDVVVSNGAGFGVNVVGALDSQHSPANVNLAGAAGSLDFNLGAFGNPTSAPLNVTGTLNVAGTVTVNVADANPQVGQFPLIKYGTKTGAGSFVIGTLPAGVSATLVNNTGNSSIDLNITSTSLIRWGGEVSAVWDINTTANWTNVVGGTSAKYTEGAAVFLEDSAAGTTAITLGVTVNPGSVVVTNGDASGVLPTSVAYSISGAGSISGATGLTKQGTNSLTISTVNNYTGPTVISGGTLSINSLPNGGSPSPIGSSSASASSLILGGGTLKYTGPAAVTDRGYTIAAGNSALEVDNEVTFNGPITSAINGDFAKTGNGTLYVRRLGATTLSASGGLGAYDIVNGTVIMDGTAGSQTLSVTGELSSGTTTNSTGGHLVLSNTTLNVSSWFAVARGTGLGGLTSSVALYNSKLQSQNGAMCFDAGIAGTLQTGELTLNGTSTYTNTGDSNFGESTGGRAIITMNDTSVLFSQNRFQLGWHNSATGQLTIANSAKVVVNAWMSIGNEGGDGTVLVKDSGTLSLPGGASDLNVCDVSSGTATFTVQDSATVSANNLFVGKGDGSTAVYNQNGGISMGPNGGGMRVEVSSQPFSTGTLNLNGGTMKARRFLSVGGGASYINFNGAQVIAERDGGNGVNPNYLTNITTATVLSGGAKIDTGTNNITIAQALVDGGGGGGLIKTGTGTLLLNGVNTYTGNTVASGTLGGSGTIAGNVSAQSLSPGTSIGQLTIGGNLTFSGNLTAEVDTSVSPSNDVVSVTGTLNYTGAGSVSVVNLGPGLQVGDKFYLFDKPVTGGAALSVTGGGANWQNNLAVDGSIQVLSLATPPTFNPSSVAILPDGNKSVTGTGSIGVPYRLWASTNVALTPITSTWTLLNSGTVATSPFTINDLTATNFPRRFYIFSTP